MRDENDRARVLHQRFQQHVFGAQVEVIRRLVEQQEICRVEQHLQQRIAVPLSS